MKISTIVGLHIPKCAGTTLLNRVQSCLPRNQVFQNTSIIKNFQQENEDLLHIRAKRRLRFVWGHTIHEELLKLFGPDIVLITGLREPLERFRSELHYMVRLAEQQGRPRPDVAARIRAVRNPICHFLVDRFPTIAGSGGNIADQAINVIEAFHFVYFSESFEETASAVFRAMGINPKPLNSNVAVGAEPELFDIDPVNHAFDLKLYERAQALFKDVTAEATFQRTPDRLKKFLATPIDLQKARNFMYGSSYYEYCNWNALDQVVQQKQRQIDELQYEIDFYRKMKAGSTPS